MRMSRRQLPPAAPVLQEGALAVQEELGATGVRLLLERATLWAVPPRQQLLTRQRQSRRQQRATLRSWPPSMSCEDEVGMERPSLWRGLFGPLEASCSLRRPVDFKCPSGVPLGPRLWRQPLFSLAAACALRAPWCSPSRPSMAMC